MAHYKEGDHIFLTFEDYNNEEYFKGWLTLGECSEAIKVTYGGDCDVIRVIKHTYAFWGIGNDICGEPQQFLYERSNRGRGRFKVTIVESKRNY